MTSALTLPLLMLACALLASLLALVLITAFSSGPDRGAAAGADAADSRQNRCAFLFEGASLVDATPPARGLFETLPRRGSDLDRLLAFLAPRIDGL